MTEGPIDHRSIAVQTFNDTWELISKPDRSDAQTEEMIHMAHASAWHWSRAEDRTVVNSAVAAWQLSRVYALAGSLERSRHYGQRSLDLALEHRLGPFFVAYGYEALARAAALEGNRAATQTYLAAARTEAERVESDKYRQAVLDDLGTIAPFV